MRRTISLVLIIFMLLTLTSCAKQPSETADNSSKESTPGAQLSTTPEPSPALTDSAATESSAALAKSTTTNPSNPIPEPYTPEGIFGIDINPYCIADFPNFFSIYAAGFDIGNDKLDGMARYVLSMTAEGNSDEVITFLAKLAGLNEKDTNMYIQEYDKGKFCEFKGSDDSTYTIRATASNDDRYSYVEGCHIDIWFNVNSNQIEKYIKLVSDNYNLKALEPAAEYLHTEPDYEECGISVNLHKKKANITVVYTVTDVSAVEQSIAEHVNLDWYDTGNGKMGLSYGSIDIVLQFDSEKGKIYVTETTSDFAATIASYTEPEVSLNKLGFSYADKDFICIYEDKKNNLEIALYKPEWGEISGESIWNIEYLDAVNGYLIAMWYYSDINEFQIQIDKSGSSCGYHYYPATGTYDDGYPDPDLVKQMFGAAFNAQGDDVYPLAVKRFEQTLKERFGLDWQELYELPIR